MITDDDDDDAGKIELSDGGATDIFFRLPESFEILARGKWSRSSLTTATATGKKAGRMKLRNEINEREYGRKGTNYFSGRRSISRTI